MIRKEIQKGNMKKMKVDEERRTDREMEGR